MRDTRDATLDEWVDVAVGLATAAMEVPPPVLVVVLFDGHDFELHTLALHQDRQSRLSFPHTLFDKISFRPSPFTRILLDTPYNHLRVYFRFPPF